VPEWKDLLLPCDCEAICGIAIGPCLRVSAVRPDIEETLYRRNAAVPKDYERLIPNPLIVKVKINGHPANALLDTGSYGDFILSSLADQLRLKHTELNKQIPLQLAVQGLHPKINCGTVVQFKYQNINCPKYFDIINIFDYDLILGTLFLFQHKSILTINLPSIEICSDVPLDITSEFTMKLHAGATALASEDLQKVHDDLHWYAESKGLYVDPGTAPLPPFHTINHEILLVDPDLVIPWRPSRCPDVFKEQWAKKKAQYLNTGHWRVSTSRNTVLMLMIPKPNKPKNKPELRTAIDLRA
jgi:hypothetical protein